MFYGGTAALMCVGYVWRHKFKCRVFRWIIAVFIPVFLFEALYLHSRYQYTFVIISWALILVLWVEKWYNKKVT